MAGVTLSVLWMRTQLYQHDSRARAHVDVVLELLGEGVRQPRKAPIVHPHGDRF